MTVVSDLEKGGTQRAAVNFAIGYRELDHDSRVLVLNDQGGVRAATLAEASVPVLNWAEADAFGLSRKWIPDLVHIHSHGCEERIIREIYQRYGSNRVTYVETNVFSVPQPWEPLLKYSFQMSDWGKWNYFRQGGDPEKARKVPYPVRVFRNQSLDRNQAKLKLGIPREAVVIGRVGQEARRKWSGIYPSVLKQLGKEESLYFISVNPPASIKLAIDKVLGSRHISFPEITDDTVLSEIYQSMDCFLHIADQGETFGYVLVEAALHGVPSVSLATPWADNAQPEIVLNGITGFVVRKRSKLATYVSKALEYKWDKGLMAEVVTNRFDARQVCGQLITEVFEGSSNHSNPQIVRYPEVLSTSFADRFWDSIPRRLAWILLGSWSWKKFQQVRSRFL